MTNANEIYLESCWDSFWWNLHEGNYKDCCEIIRAAEKVSPIAGQAMQEEMLNYPAKAFLTPSPFV